MFVLIGLSSSPILTLASASTGEDPDKFCVGILTAIAGQLPKAVRRRIEEHERAISRRKFLTQGSAVAAGLFGSWLATDAKYFRMLTFGSPSEQASFNRLLLRLYGLSSHLHLEDPIIFTRNLIMALKMKNLADYIKQENRNSLLAFNLGAAHGGIEDFIYLPKDVLRTMIAYINKEWFQASMEKYGKHFCSTRIIQADEYGRFQDITVLSDRKLEAMLA